MMGEGYAKGFGFALETKGECSLCGNTLQVESLVGGPVGCICADCRDVITKWEKGKTSQRDWWRQCNNVSLAIQDEEEIGLRLMEIEIYMAEIERVLVSNETTRTSIVQQNLPTCDMSDYQRRIYNGESADKVIRKSILEMRKSIADIKTNLVVK